MTRIGKKAERRAVSPRKHKKPSTKKTGPKKDNLSLGYKSHENALQSKQSLFIAKVK